MKDINLNFTSRLKSTTLAKAFHWPNLLMRSEKKPPKTALVEPFLVIQQCVEERRNFCAWASRNLQKFLLGARKYRYHRKKGHLMDKIRNAFKELGPAVFWSFELFCAEHFKNWARLHKKLLRSKQILQREKNTRQIVLHCTVHIFT